MNQEKPRYLTVCYLDGKEYPIDKVKELVPEDRLEEVVIKLPSGAQYRPFRAGWQLPGEES